MSDCNQDYYVMVYDPSMKDRRDYAMGYYGSERTHIMTETHFNQPIRFDIELHEEESKKDYIRHVPEDVILHQSYGLLFSNDIKEKYFATFQQEDTVMHNAYIVAPDGEYFEGYWFLPTPDKPKNWLDKDKFVELLEFNIGMEMGGSKIPKTAI